MTPLCTRSGTTSASSTSIQSGFPCTSSSKTAKLASGQWAGAPQTGVCGLCHPTHLHLLFLLFYAPSLEGNSLTCGLRLREKTVFIRSFLATTGDPKGPFLRLSCSVRLFFFPPQKKPQAEKRHSWVCSWCLTGHSSASGCC